MTLLWDSKADHDEYEMDLQNFRLLDNTKYPHTLPVDFSYNKDAKKYSQYVLGFFDRFSDSYSDEKSF